MEAPNDIWLNGTLPHTLNQCQIKIGSELGIFLQKKPRIKKAPTLTENTTQFSSFIPTELHSVLFCCSYLRISLKRHYSLISCLLGNLGCFCNAIEIDDGLIAWGLFCNGTIPVGISEMVTNSQNHATSLTSLQENRLYIFLLSTIVYKTYSCLVLEILL